jgi:glycosyltransferase involved in cell wall biosynthesis
LAVDISIIIASFNKRNFVAETILSVLRQTYTEFELIIIDDASSDGTQEIIKNHAVNDSRIKYYFNKENRGANYCRNKGIAVAAGSHLMFIDADDLLTQTCLQTRMERAIANPHADVWVFTMGVFNSTIGDDARKWIPPHVNHLRRFLQHRLPWSIMQPLWKTELVRAVGGFDESFERLQDVEFHTRVLLKSDIHVMTFRDDPDCFYRINEDRKTSSEAELMQKWVDAACKYYSKFMKIVPFKLSRTIMGTLVETYLQLLYRHKRRRIDRNTFISLENRLFNVMHPTFTQKTCFGLMRINNYSSISLPGINWFLRRILSGV